MIGLELEIADVYNQVELPDGCKWSSEDGTIINSIGLANDPFRIDNHYGGEINTKPTETVEEQIAVVENILSRLENANINYKCNIHCHVSIPGLVGDTEKVKQMLKWFYENQETIFTFTDDVDIPNKFAFSDLNEYLGALARYKNDLISHQMRIPKARFKNMMKAQTWDQLLQAHMPAAEEELQHAHYRLRHGINTRQLWKEHGTIEYRHFYGSIDIQEIKSILTWCHNVTYAAYNNISIEEVLKGDYVFPKKQPYNHRLQQLWELTNYQYNERSDVNKFKNILGL